MRQQLKEGVALRDEGADEISNCQAALDWVVRAEDWRKHMFNEIKRLDANVAEDFELLDVVSPPRIGISTKISDHARQYR